MLLPSGQTLRQALFASTLGDRGGKHMFIPVGHALNFLRANIDEHWEMLRHADSRDAAFGFLMTLAKADKGLRLTRDA